MNTTDKINLILRGVIIVLFIILLAIFYQYSENGRYTYHHSNNEIYIVDSRTGTYYLHDIEHKCVYIIDAPSGNILNIPMRYHDKTKGGHWGKTVTPEKSK